MANTKSTGDSTSGCRCRGRVQPVRVPSGVGPGGYSGPAAAPTSGIIVDDTGAGREDVRDCGQAADRKPETAGTSGERKVSKRVHPGWFKTLFTDDNNQWDIGFHLWAAGVLMFLGLSLWVYALRQWVTGIPLAPWDPMAFGTGLGLVLAAGGVMSRLRAPTTVGLEPDKGSK